MKVLLCRSKCVLVFQNCNKEANCKSVLESTPCTFIARRVKNKQVREIVTALIASALKVILSFSVVSICLIKINVPRLDLNSIVISYGT